MLRTDGGKPKKVFESFITKVFITFYDLILLQNNFVISYALLNTNIGLVRYTLDIKIPKCTMFITTKYQNKSSFIM